VHDTQEGSAWNAARQAADCTRLDVDDECVAEALSHESNTLVVWGKIGSFTEVREDLNVAWELIERTGQFSFRLRLAVEC
jgi:hypothetical protein